MKKQNFHLVLLEKPGGEGLTFSEIQMLYDMLDKKEVIPVEISGCSSEALGFIDPKAFYDELDWYSDYQSNLHDYIKSILDDMELEDKLMVDSYEDNGNLYRIYEFNGLRIWLNR